MERLYRFRRIRPEECAQYRRLRLQAARSDPAAFLLTENEEKRLPKSDLETILRQDWILGVFHEQDLLGAVRLIRQTPLKFRHIGLLGGLYVKPEYRGLGLGKELLLRIIEKARRRKSLSFLQLKVVTTNATAMKLYAKCGFRRWATEKDALQQNGKHTDQHHYRLDLRTHPGILPGRLKVSFYGTMDPQPVQQKVQKN